MMIGKRPMVTVEIESGICGFCTIVRAFRLQRKSVGIAIKSGCKQVLSFADQLKRLEMSDIIKNPINSNSVYKEAGKCNLHASCPVPCGVIKAAEAELGLALMKDVKIVFQTQDKESGDAM